MGPAEITAIVVALVAVIEGLLALIRHILHKRNGNGGHIHHIKNRVDSLYEMHNKHDQDGIPIWYVPRSSVETQKEIVDRLYVVSQTQSKTLDIIERLENRLKE